MTSIGQLMLHFALLSLVAFGGGNAILPELHRLVVVEQHWMNDALFTQLFALSQAAPGPNILIVSLIGLDLAGIPGFFALTLAFCLPAGIMMYGFTLWWQRQQDAAWRNAAQAAVGPLAAGLVFAAGWLVSQTAVQGNWRAGLLTLFAVALTLGLRRNPLWWVAGGALLGALGVV